MKTITLPGIIDLSVRAYDIASETKAAHNAGVAAICLQPDSLNPIVDKAAVVEALNQHLQEQAHCQVLPLGAISQQLEGLQLAEMAALKQAGCVALSDAGRAFDSTLVLKRAMEYAHSTDIALHLTPRDNSLAQGGCAHDGIMASRLGLSIMPSSAETGALAMMLELVAETGTRVHFSQISTWRSVELIQRAKERKLPVTADVSIHHLSLTEDALAGFNTLCHIIPPLRTEQDRAALLEGINQGILDAITSQHIPCSEDEKLAPFPASKPGISGVELLLPLTLKLIDKGELNPEAALAALTTGPANVLGINPLDEVTIELEADQTIAPETLLSKGKNCPYIDWSLSRKARD